MLATTLSLVVIFVPVSFMSSISGRFLYQFGLTAAAAVLVSLLVSFTLTPMMSARMLRADGRRLRPWRTATRSRQGFYARIDRGYERLLRFTMAHRRAAALLCLGVMLASIPLFKLVKVEYIPSDVDESEFEVNVTRPRGDEPRRHRRGDARHRGRDPPGARRPQRARHGGRRLPGRRQPGERLRAHRAERGAQVLDRPLPPRPRPPRPRRRLPRQLQPAGGDDGGPRPARQVPRPALRRCATSPPSTSAAATTTSTSPCAARTSRRSPATPSSCG